MGTNNRVIFIAGITFLLFGIVLKIIDAPKIFTIVAFSLGGILKSFYVVNGFRSGILAGRLYLGTLLFGLLLLFLSVSLRNGYIESFQADIMLFIAISIKVFSIVAMKRSAKIRNVSQYIKK